MSDALNTPWKIWNKLGSVFVYPYIRLLFAFYNIPWGNHWRFYGIPIIQKHRRSLLRIGDGLQLRSATASNPLGVNHPVILATWQENSCLEIGENFAMTGGAICVVQSVRIGNNVNIGANSSIVDTDFHPITPSDRRKNPSAGKSLPVVIEDDVFIGMNCIILKGVSIGQGSVIGAGSVVTKSIPPFVIAAGNPAVVVKELRF